jgi:hypothetical protein
MVEGKSLGQLVAGLVGVVYTVLGVVGFAITGFSGFVSANSGHSLLGFPLNPFQDLIHLAIGLLFLWAATQDSGVTEGILIGGGGVYVVAAIAGFIYAHVPVIAITTAGNPDNYLHLVSGLTAMAAGVLSAAGTQRSRRTAY